MQTTSTNDTAARARGRTGGRPPLLFGDKQTTAQKFYGQQDMTVAQIGEVLGVSRTTIYRALRRAPQFTPTQHRQAKKPI